MTAEPKHAEPQATEFDTTEEGEEDLLSTTSAAAAASLSISPSQTPTPPLPHAATAFAPSVMDVDGNGTGAMMKRSQVAGAGGVDPPLMASNPSLAFPIDSGKEGLHYHHTRSRTRQSNDGIIDRAQPRTRLVRYSLSQSQSQSESTPKQGPTPTQKRLVFAPAPASSSQLARQQQPQPHQQHPSQQQRSVQRSAPRLVRYNGPDVADSTDFEGMELPSVQKARNRQLKLKKANLVQYKGASLQKRLTEEVPNGNTAIDGYNYSTGPTNIDGGDESQHQKTGTEEDHQKGRKTLVEDLGYANRYTALSDFNLARKTGLAVNKPISLWVERDKFL